ncbi:MAG TPA: AarF/ABC1/UbiB kinase family protein [Jiangellales bacterium]|nr:AarF/ABC1/UbiB kinase family protein [Jiangellales bacterium]
MSTSLATAGPVRTVRLLSLPAAAGVRAARGTVLRLAGAEPDLVREETRRANAAHARRVLGELKGGALKAGQLLSTVEMLFPADPEQSWREALVALQEGNRGLPFREVEPVLVAELGRDWPGRFRGFDEEPAAAASLGQVHRAVWADGRTVAVKVQYPGVREALAADLRAVSVATRLAALVARGMTLPPLVAELRTRLEEELDYCREGATQAAFAAAFAEDPDVVVPEVVDARSRVLVSTWLDGTPLARLADADASTRDRAGLLYQRFLLAGPARAGILHTDPHPGNFRLDGDGRLGVLDFGSALRMPDGMPPTFGRLITVLLSGDPAEVERGLREEGFVRPGVTVDARKLVDYLAPFSEPARHEVFTYSREWLRSQFGRLGDPRDPDFAVALRLDLPAEHLFTHRVWLGVVGVLAQLGATVPVRSELQRWLPGFAVRPRARPSR